MIQRPTPCNKGKSAMQFCHFVITCFMNYSLMGFDSPRGLKKIHNIHRVGNHRFQNYFFVKADSGRRHLSACECGGMFKYVSLLPSLLANPVGKGYGRKANGWQRGKD